ncbi:MULTISPECIES: hypothetical protein [Bifidobacterium]|uniref:Uncharacterized protein n=2 Tax=Bifidobacterium TaxID=1678 RepID=A0A261FTJ1_9BIFI|nr:MULTISPECIES: hypothetical protein [Bifidobacterium]OZG62479.1 hypothetical protein BLEM_1025 [Bifidobacterium lemurum]OZG69015.1 hypothetical protein BEUL_0421 [Bifidobacterium eulemuris]QOL31456.1 hypothetical protein BE0216_02525 [Bifidobacterium eulemuris]QOL33821.1 hypothetical protein BL8807_08555 [Bifidobacterium lemurum]
MGGKHSLTDLKRRAARVSKHIGGELLVSRIETGEYQIALSPKNTSSTLICTTNRDQEDIWKFLGAFELGAVFGAAHSPNAIDERKEVPA